MENKKAITPIPKIDKSSIPIILWNLTPFAGVIFLGWHPITVFICYALETIVVGIFNVFRLIAVYYYGLPKKETETGVSGLGIIPFFLVHYFFFVFVQLSIFFASSGGHGFGGIIGSIRDFMDDKSTNIALSIFVVNNAFLFVNNFILNGTFRKRTMAEQMFEPYPRIFVQQFVVILGGFVFTVTGSGLPVLIVFVFIKTYFDLLLNGLDLISWANTYQKKVDPQG